MAVAESDPPPAWVLGLGWVALLAAVSLSGFPVRGDVILPSSAYATGVNGAEFRTDVRILNPGAAAVTVVPLFYDASGGDAIEAASFEVPPRQQVAFDNVLSTLFGRPKGAFGPIRLRTSAPLVVSASVNNVDACGATGVSGLWLPGIDPGQALLRGLLGNLAASADSGSGYRTNVDLLHPGTGTATVVVRVRRGDGSLLSSVTVDLSENALYQRPLDDASFPGLAGVTGTNLWIEMASDRPILAFASVIHNASGDPYAVVAVPDVPSSAPFGSPRTVTIQGFEGSAMEPFISCDGRTLLFNNSMDAEVDRGGDLLYFANARFSGSMVPVESDIGVARRSGDAFLVTAGSAELMREVNTVALEYAPSTSADGLELFFTRSDGIGATILRSARADTASPFGSPALVGGISGFVEAPSLSCDGRSLYYHARVGGKLAVLRVVREP